MNTIKDFNAMDYLNSHFENGVYVESDRLHVEHWFGFDNWTITDITDAMKPGKTCTSYSLSNNGSHGNCDTFNWMMANFDGNMLDLFDWLNLQDWQEGKYGYPQMTIDEIVITRRDKPSAHVFSPFNLSAIKPLATTPKKWTLKDVYRALVNGQFSDLKCNGVYSDDYAYDAAVDYHRGEIAKPLDFVRRIMESPSGWRAYASGNCIMVNGHSFDNDKGKPRRFLASA